MLPIEMSVDQRLEQVSELLREGLQHQACGELDDAIRCYRRALDIQRTAEGHTYLGWAFSSKGELERAIEQCVSAINLDPEYGNPYNDIGVYLTQLGRKDEAEDWFCRAKRASRYEARHFPCINLARLYDCAGKWYEALDEIHEALSYQPGDRAAILLRAKILRRLN